MRCLWKRLPEQVGVVYLLITAMPLDSSKCSTYSSCMMTCVGLNICIVPKIFLVNDLHFEHSFVMLDHYRTHRPIYLFQLNQKYDKCLQQYNDKHIHVNFPVYCLNDHVFQH